MKRINSLGRINPNDAIIFICDVQEKFKQVITDFDELLTTSKNFIKFANIFKIPIIVTQHDQKALGETCLEIKENLPIDNSEIIKKRDFSMLPSANIFLERFPLRKTIILIGVETHICIQQTCLDLLKLDYNVHIIKNACSSQYSVDKDCAFERMAYSGAFITTSQSIYFEIMKNFDIPQFKQVLPFIKVNKTKKNPSL